MSDGASGPKGLPALEEVGLFPFDPFDPEFRREPYATYAKLREEDPVHESPLGIWVLSRYSDIVSVLHNPATSSDQTNSDIVQLFQENSPESYQAISERRRRVFLFMDPPDHTRLRSLVSKAFTPRYVDGLRPRIAEIVDGLIDVALERGALEVIEEFAYPLPMTIISEMLGVPPSDNDVFKGWSRELAQSLDPDIMLPPEVVERRQKAVEEFSEYFLGLIAERRKSPRDDLLSALIAAEEEGDKLNEEELIATCILLLVAGHETTVNLIANGVLAFLRNPAECEKLREDPALAKSAVEEVLRYDPPVQLTGRVLLEDFELGGHTIKKGQTAILLLGSANRDPEQFADPDRLDIERKPNPHIAFSVGIHFCLGAYLARAEGQVALAGFASRLPQARLSAGVLDYKENLVLRGLSALPVEF